MASIARKASPNAPGSSRTRARVMRLGLWLLEPDTVTSSGFSSCGVAPGATEPGSARAAGGFEAGAAESPGDAAAVASPLASAGSMKLTIKRILAATGLPLRSAGANRKPRAAAAAASANGESPSITRTSLAVPSRPTTSSTTHS
jgi:hypothetical protein